MKGQIKACICRMTLNLSLKQVLKEPELIKQHVRQQDSSDHASIHYPYIIYVFYAPFFPMFASGPPDFRSRYSRRFCRLASGTSLTTQLGRLACGPEPSLRPVVLFFHTSLSGATGWSPDSACFSLWQVFEKKSRKLLEGEREEGHVSLILGRSWQSITTKSLNESAEKSAIVSDWDWTWPWSVLWKSCFKVPRFFYVTAKSVVLIFCWFHFSSIPKMCWNFFLRISTSVHSLLKKASSKKSRPVPLVLLPWPWPWPPLLSLLRQLVLLQGLWPPDAWDPRLVQHPVDHLAPHKMSKHCHLACCVCVTLCMSWVKGILR